MSTINVTNLSGRGGGTPNLPDGAVISGVATVTNLKPTNVNVSGAVTATTVVATTFDGSLKSTGTPTLGLGVTINSSGLVVSGVTTAGIGSFTTVYGDGSNLTGVGGSIGVWYQTPDVNDTGVELSSTGIAVTFSTKVVAGSGTATMKIVNAGVAGTTIQSWGIGSCTFSVDTPQKLTFGAILSNLTTKQTYEISIPEGFVKDSSGTEYVGTAWTFTTTAQVYSNMFWVGTNTNGSSGLNNPDNSKFSSPVQIPGTSWIDLSDMIGIPYNGGAIRNDGTLWVWGENNDGELGDNTTINRSSPTQIPGTTWGSDLTQFGSRSKLCFSREAAAAIKNDGTLWVWGKNQAGRLGQNQESDNLPRVSSPVQVPGTTWKQVVVQTSTTTAIKTDGTLWQWGNNGEGQLGLNSSGDHRSSPAQVPGTTWNEVSASNEEGFFAVKTDGTLWAWGKNGVGQLGQNQPDNSHRSSPTQIPGTTWATVSGAEEGAIATKTDGTLWAWGSNTIGRLGQNDLTARSSPTQIPGTTWGITRATVTTEQQNAAVIKTDGTLWTWGRNEAGELGQNQAYPGGDYSSPVQVGSENDWVLITDPYDALLGLRQV